MSDRPVFPPRSALGEVYLCNWDGERLCGYRDDGKRVCELLYDHDGEHEWTGRVAW